LRFAATSADLSVVVRRYWGKEGKEVKFDEREDERECETEVRKMEKVRQQMAGGIPEDVLLA
jgi:hypothetical protein